MVNSNPFVLFISPHKKLQQKIFAFVIFITFAITKSTSPFYKPINRIYVENPLFMRLSGDLVELQHILDSFNFGVDIVLLA